MGDRRLGLGAVRLGVRDDKEHKEQGGRADLCGQGQTQGHAQSNRPAAAAVLSCPGAKIQDQHDKEGEQGVGRVKVGQLHREHSKPG